MSTNPAPAKVAVVSRAGCVQCNATYRDLNRLGVEYFVDLDSESTDHALAVSLGHRQAPVVLVRDGTTGELLDHWSGFRPDKIAGLVQEAATQAA
ncbi:glutaredoxin domain-containing protein [Specibacter sp. RAF43]|uniref:glutaredoxin domain-containing protein n=1 Tax=Specibacter sp. RAF43 TaxID=3233057 RepID=UPI003F985F92